MPFDYFRKKRKDAPGGEDKPDGAPEERTPEEEALAERAREEAERRAAERRDDAGDVADLLGGMLSTGEEDSDGQSEESDAQDEDQPNVGMLLGGDEEPASVSLDSAEPAAPFAPFEDSDAGDLEIRLPALPDAPAGDLAVPGTELSPEMQAVKERLMSLGRSEPGAALSFASEGDATSLSQSMTMISQSRRRHSVALQFEPEDAVQEISEIPEIPAGAEPDITADETIVLDHEALTNAGFEPVSETSAAGESEEPVSETGAVPPPSIKVKPREDLDADTLLKSLDEDDADLPVDDRERNPEEAGVADQVGGEDLELSQVYSLDDLPESRGPVSMGSGDEAGDEEVPDDSLAENELAGMDLPDTDMPEEDLGEEGLDGALAAAEELGPTPEYTEYGEHADPDSIPESEQPTLVEDQVATEVAAGDESGAAAAAAESSQGEDQATDIDSMFESISSDAGDGEEPDADSRVDTVAAAADSQGQEAIAEQEGRPDRTEPAASHSDDYDIDDLPEAPQGGDIQEATDESSGAEDEMAEQTLPDLAAASVAGSGAGEGEDPGSLSVVERAMDNSMRPSQEQPMSEARMPPAPAPEPEAPFQGAEFASDLSAGQLEAVERLIESEIEAEEHEEVKETRVVSEPRFGFVIKLVRKAGSMLISGFVSSRNYIDRKLAPYSLSCRILLGIAGIIALMIVGALSVKTWILPGMG